VKTTVNQKRISELAGVSQTVVSRVLAGQGRRYRVAEHTIRKVEEVAKVLNYVPNPGVRIMQGRSTKLIGVVIKSFSDPYLVSILESLKTHASTHGLMLMITCFENGEFSEKDERLLSSFNPDAYFVIGSVDFSTWSQRFFTQDKPIVSFGHRGDNKKVSYIFTDVDQGTRLLLDLFCENEYSDIRFVLDGLKGNRIRYEAFVRNAESRGLRKSREASFESRAIGVEAGREIGARLAASGSLPEAMCAMDDAIAIGVIKGLIESGVPFGGLPAITGFDDIGYAQLVSPALTTIRQPINQMVRRAIDMIVEGTLEPLVSFEPRLVIRDSVPIRRSDSNLLNRVER